MRSCCLQQRSRKNTLTACEVCEEKGEKIVSEGKGDKKREKGASEEGGKRGETVSEEEANKKRKKITCKEGGKKRGGKACKEGKEKERERTAHKENSNIKRNR